MITMVVGLTLDMVVEGLTLDMVVEGLTLGMVVEGLTLDTVDQILEAEDMEDAMDLPLMDRLVDSEVSEDRVDQVVGHHGAPVEMDSDFPQTGMMIVRISISSLWIRESSLLQSLLALVRVVRVSSCTSSSNGCSADTRGTNSSMESSLRMKLMLRIFQSSPLFLT